VKIEQCQLNSHPFEAAFSGIDRVSCLEEDGIFFCIYLTEFHFERVNTLLRGIKHVRKTYISDETPLAGTRYKFP
jgi:hypothetical protein